MSQLLLFIVLCGFLITQCESQTCPSGDFFPYSCGSCLSFASNPQRSFSQSQSACTDFNLGTLAVAGTEQELSALQDYGGALGSSFWIGYRYNSSGTLLSSDVGMEAPTFVSSAVSEAASFDTGDCVAVTADGSLTRFACSDELGYACQFSVTVPTVENIMVTVNGQLDSSGSVIANFSDTLSIQCTFGGTDSSSVVQWLLNEKEINSSSFDTAPDRNSSQLDIMFETAGIYQCVVTNMDGRSVTGEVDVCGDIEGANPPSSVSFIAVPENRTSLFFRWFRPEQLNVLHPFLLRYTLFYTTNTTADYDSDQSVSGLMTDANGVGTYFLTGLGVGVEYRVGIRAMSGSIVGAEPEYVVGVATYGLAPTDVPAGLLLRRRTDDTALLAEWDPLVTNLPTGNISFYQVEFRSGLLELRDVVSTILIDPDFSFASIFGVVRAQAYQVRVAGVVRVQRSRSRSAYEPGPFTGWVEVSGVVDEVPSPATISPLEPESVSTILLAVLVPTLAVILAIFVTAVVIVCIVTKPFKANGVENSLQSQPSATNMGTVEEKKPIGDPVKPSETPDSAL